MDYEGGCENLLRYFGKIKILRHGEARENPTRNQRGVKAKIIQPGAKEQAKKTTSIFNAFASS